MLEQLCRGDVEATRSAFVAYEPYLRLVVRRHLSPALRAKFDSVDVVQSVWANLLVGFRDGNWSFESTEQLRAFLVRATRNRLIDRVRRERAGLLHEQPLDYAQLADECRSPQPEVGANLAAEELWLRLLALCPVQHQGLLAMKREGLSLAEIAGRTGLHESSVRRILYDLASRLATVEASSASAWAAVPRE
jgi:RNA polymerase sigma-70 factor (ECF subfamily)